MILEVNVNSMEETRQLAESLAGVITSGTVILLEGNLGAGKTTFTQFIGTALGVKRRMSSPTFNIIKSYNAEYVIHHMDCYRLEHSEEDLGFDEYFNGEDISIVEWPQYIEDFLPEEYLSIAIENKFDDTRLFTLKSNGDKYVTILEALENVITSD
ncbi:tRNA (adenosine(37)-N6)-threonylcarbamoyltransferase complex ATPase subunit type 1 TsaE [Salinicoccus sp. HZC-1]|uniref:tRNA (adenosine(37)-N6)-threonylcarbamoyltransferase complex ATPase subunit type 1 TsaE n=1 Tax=Salinicoccus sp. HZC-1 TaxID=3385497 RepID=UPI00398B8DDA